MKLGGAGRRRQPAAFDLGQAPAHQIDVRNGSATSQQMPGDRLLLFLSLIHI